MEKVEFSGDPWELVDPFVREREENSSIKITEQIKSAARFLIEHELELFNGEQFCIAICCELDLEIQRKAAWFLVSDMLNGEFSWITSLLSLSMEKPLFEAGIIPKNYFINERFREDIIKMGRVRFYSSEIPKCIIEKFNLPTHRLHPEKILTGKEKEERRLFNAYYRSAFGNEAVL